MNQGFNDINKDIKNITSGTTTMGTEDSDMRCDVPGSNLSNLGATSTSSGLGSYISDIPKSSELGRTSGLAGQANLGGTGLSDQSNLGGISGLSDVSGLRVTNLPYEGQSIGSSAGGIGSNMSGLGDTASNLIGSDLGGATSHLPGTSNLSGNLDDLNKNIGGSSNLSGPGSSRRLY